MQRTPEARSSRRIFVRAVRQEATKQHRGLQGALVRPHRVRLRLLGTHPTKVHLARTTTVDLVHAAPIMMDELRRLRAENAEMKVEDPSRMIERIAVQG